MYSHGISYSFQAYYPPPPSPGGYVFGCISVTVVTVTSQTLECMFMKSEIRLGLTKGRIDKVLVKNTLIDRGWGGGGWGGVRTPPFQNNVKGFNPKYKIIS